MSNLFKDNEEWTPEASALYSEAIDLLRPLVDKWYDKGFKAREIAYVVDCALKNEELKNVALSRGKQEAGNLMEDQEKEDPLDTLIHWRKMEAMSYRPLGGGLYSSTQKGK